MDFKVMQLKRILKIKKGNNIKYLVRSHVMGQATHNMLENNIHILIYI